MKDQEEHRADGEEMEEWFPQPGSEPVGPSLRRLVNHLLSSDLHHDSGVYQMGEV